MLRSRVLTALVALPLLLALLILGPPWSIALFFFIAAVLAWREYCLLIGRPAAGLTYVGWLTSAAVMALLLWAHPAWLILTAPLSLAAMAMVSLSLFGREEQAFTQMERTWLGLVLILLPLGSLAGLVICLPFGRVWMFFLLAVVFGSDTAAYFVGRAWGKTKLYQAVSPNKTVAGAYGGLAAGLVVGVAAGILDGGAPLFDILIGGFMGLVLAALSMIGDLLISMLKRTYKVKDSGSLLPGHGGILDRLDSFILAGPVLVAFLTVWKLVNG